MLLTIIPFYLFLPTLVAWFGAYSFARFHDLKWGNRPSNQMKDSRHQEELAKACQIYSILLPGSFWSWLTSSQSLGLSSTLRVSCLCPSLFRSFYILSHSNDPS